MKLLVTATILLLSLGIMFTSVQAQVVTNSASMLDGTGFAVTENTLETSQLDLFLSPPQQTGSRANFTVEDGFITLGDDDFVVSEATGTLLRDDRFVRMSITAENFDEEQITLSIFGKLIQKSNDGSVYSFTGKLRDDSNAFKVVYTSRITEFSSSINQNESSIEADTNEENEIIIRILEGSHSTSGGTDYRTLLSKPVSQLQYYSQDRIEIDPGTTITWINDDIVSHSITSGSGLGGSAGYKPGHQFVCEKSETTNETQNCSFVPDGRINSGEILPGESWSYTVSEIGFYRTADVDYPWMNQVIYAFGDSDSQLIKKTGNNPLGN